MAEQRIHYLALGLIEDRLKVLREEREKASIQVYEALNKGDLKENSEHDMAKDDLMKIVKEIDTLTPALSYTPIQANPSIRVIEEGCVIRLKIYSVTPEPLKTKPVDTGDKDEFIFNGLLMYGGAVPGQDLLNDRSLSSTSPIGMAILGKPPGYFTARVPGGHANFIVEKILRDEVTQGEVTAETLLREEIYVQ